MNRFPNPAHRQLVRRFVDWELIEHRCSEFTAIGRAFDLKTLRAGFEKPPYYCHYMAWRLGTWETEGLFTRLEEVTIQEPTAAWVGCPGRS